MLVGDDGEMTLISQDAARSVKEQEKDEVDLGAQNEAASDTQSKWTGNGQRRATKDAAAQRLEDEEARKRETDRSQRAKEEAGRRNREYGESTYDGIIAAYICETEECSDCA